MDEFPYELMPTEVPRRIFSDLNVLFMKPTATLRLVHFVFCVGLMLGASTAWSQIGLPPTEQPPKGEKLDEQTLMQNRMREK